MCDAAFAGGWAGEHVVCLESVAEGRGWECACCSLSPQWGAGEHVVQLELAGQRVPGAA